MDINAILNAREGIEKIMGDVLRVLRLYRRLWLTEIHMEIEGMNSTLKEEVPSYDDVSKAVKELSNLGYVQVERGIRGSLQHAHGIEDYLITMIDDPKIINALTNDKKLSEYIRIRYSFMEI
ncbi:MAG: hypothetical protein QXT53_01305 [Ignisphaera sp.]